MKRFDQIRLLLFALAFASMLWGYRLLIFKHAPEVFSEPIEDMSYGWYVPLFSLYVLWRERRELQESFGAPSLVGLVFVLPFFFLGFLGARGGQMRFEVVGFAGLFLALVWSIFGRQTMKQALFPALFLLFCIPLHSFLDIVTIHLRMLSVSIAYGFLQGLGVDVIREGTMLASSTGTYAIDIAEPCSGLRSLFAMLALTSGYAYFTQPTWCRRGLLVALAIPIAVLGNVIRIFTIVAVAASCSPDFATGFYHDYSGFIVFFAAIALMVTVGGLITKGAEKCGGS